MRKQSVLVVYRGDKPEVPCMDGVDFIMYDSSERDPFWLAGNSFSGVLFMDDVDDFIKAYCAALVRFEIKRDS